MVLAHLQRRRRFGEEKIFQCALNYMMVLGLKFCVDPLCFGSNMHVGCVALCISFPKCPISSKLKFGAKSYSHFSAESRAQDSGSGLSPLGPVLESEPCSLGPDHVLWVWLSVFTCA